MLGANIHQRPVGDQIGETQHDHVGAEIPAQIDQLPIDRLDRLVGGLVGEVA